MQMHFASIIIYYSPLFVRHSVDPYVCTKMVRPIAKLMARLMVRPIVSLKVRLMTSQCTKDKNVLIYALPMRIYLLVYL